jgi:glutaconate CoA-transferase subunit A
MEERLTSLPKAVSLIRDGDVVALQNMATQSAPMALVRELIRQGKKDIGLVILVGGIAVDWLAATGVINRLIGAAVSMEQFGLCQQYRQAVERGEIRVEELSESLLNARLGAGARHLPFLPSRGAIGTDLVAQNPENLRLIDDPFGGRSVIACRELRPDVALLHAHRADCYGNIQVDATAMWPDFAIMPKAADKVIVSVEEIVDSEVLRQSPEKTKLPGFMIDAVVETPFGAHPTSFFPVYGYDSRFHREWVSVSRDRAAAGDFLQAHVFGPRDQADYLQSVGGDETVRRIGASGQSA